MRSDAARIVSAAMSSVPIFSDYRRSRQRGNAERLPEQMRVFIEHGLEPARVRVFQHTLPVRFARKFRANRFDDLRVVEKRKKGSSRACGDVTQRKAECAGSLRLARA